jgi:hypothetical protein
MNIVRKAVEKRRLDVPFGCHATGYFPVALLTCRYAACDGMASRRGSLILATTCGFLWSLAGMRAVDPLITK